MKPHVSLFAFFSLLVIASAVHAQSGDMQALRHVSTTQTWIGLRGGPNIADESVTASSEASSGPRVGFHGGLQINQWFTDMFAISIGGLVDQKGVHQSYSTNSAAHPLVYGDDDYALSYFEVPILIRAAFGHGDARPYLFAGPSIGFLMSATETTTQTVPKIQGDLKSALSSTDLSLFFGGGVMDKVSRQFMITIDAGYAMGLSNIYKSQIPGPNDPLTRTTTDNHGASVLLIDNSGAKSGDFRVAVGFLFAL